jgi:hypothetical protein
VASVITKNKIVVVGINITTLYMLLAEL